MALSIYMTLQRPLEMVFQLEYLHDLAKATRNGVSTCSQLLTHMCENTVSSTTFYICDIMTKKCAKNYLKLCVEVHFYMVHKLQNLLTNT